MLVIPSRIIATCFALVCFAAAAAVGFATGNPLTTILGRAILIMIVAWIIGHAIGFVMQKTADEYLASYQIQHPIPGDEPDTAQVGDVEILEDETSTAAPGGSMSNAA